MSYGSQALAKAGVENTVLESRILLQYLMRCELEDFLKLGEAILEQSLCDVFYALIERRCAREPIAYIIGHKEFYGLKFHVNESVLIPRCDSEVLIDAALSETSIRDRLKILDIGTGSGCLIIALMTALNNSRGWAVDISEKALETARRNSLELLNGEKITFIHSDCFANLAEREFDIIISNPPYIALEETKYMSPETSYEPDVALFAENNGLNMYQKIASKAAKYLKQNGRIYLEVGFKQSKQVQDIFEQNGFSFVRSYSDIQGYVRCMQFTANI